MMVDFPRLQQMGLSINEVVQRLDEQNREVSGGRVIGLGAEYMTRTVGRLSEAEDLENIIFHNAQGKKIYLRDFARIEDAGERQRIFAWVNDDEAIKVVLLKQPDANTVDVADRVHERLAALEKQGLFPTDTNLKIMLDQSWFIKNSIRDVSTAIAIGGGLAILVVIFFLGSLRRTFIIALSIPIALVVTFFLMKITGLTLNIFSLGGLALGVGMLVDNSIVMLENISRHQECKDDPVAAAHNGAKEVESALWASAGTNLAAILPFLFISGIAALLFREMVLTISFAMVLSLLVGLTLVATLSAKLLCIPRSSRIDRFFLIRGFQGVIAWANGWYARSLGGMLRFRYLVLGIILAGFAAVYPLYEQLGTELLPPVDDHRATIYVRFPPGAHAERKRSGRPQARQQRAGAARERIHLHCGGRTALRPRYSPAGDHRQCGHQHRPQRAHAGLHPEAQQEGPVAGDSRRPDLHSQVACPGAERREHQPPARHQLEHPGRGSGRTGRVGE